MLETENYEIVARFYRDKNIIKEAEVGDLPCSQEALGVVHV
jgi:hypothetical protein